MPRTWYQKSLNACLKLNQGFWYTLEMAVSHWLVRRRDKISMMSHSPSFSYVKSVLRRYLNSHIIVEIIQEAWCVLYKLVSVSPVFGGGDGTGGEAAAAAGAAAMWRRQEGGGLGRPRGGGNCPQPRSCNACQARTKDAASAVEVLGSLPGWWHRCLNTLWRCCQLWDPNQGPGTQLKGFFAQLSITAEQNWESSVCVIKSGVTYPRGGKDNEDWCNV